MLAVVTTAALGFTDNTAVWAVLRFVSGLSSTAGLLLASGLALNWLFRHGHRPELGLQFTGLGLGVGGFAGFGLWGVWGSLAFYIVTLAAVMFIKFRGGSWRHIKI